MIKTHIQPTDTSVFKRTQFNRSDVLATTHDRNHRRAQLLKAAMLENHTGGVIQMIVESSSMCSKVITQVAGISDERVFLSCGNSIPITSIRHIAFEH